MTEESIFAEAVALTDVAARAAYLDRICAGNAELRAAVEALLAAHATGSPLDHPPASLDRTGPYTRSTRAPATASGRTNSSKRLAKGRWARSG